MVVDEFVFCPAASGENTSTSEMISSVLYGISFLHQLSFKLPGYLLDVSKSVHHIEPWYTAAQTFNGTLLAKDLENLKHRRSDGLAG